MAWDRLGDFLRVQTLLKMFGATSSATVIAFLVHAIHAGVLISVFAVLAAFAGGGLIVSAVTAVGQRLRYRWKWLGGTRTWLEVYGGEKIALAVRHQGLPVKVRLRFQIDKSNKTELDEHREPHDLNLYTRVYGGVYRSIELSNNFDLAKADLATTRFREPNDRTLLTFHLPPIELTCPVGRFDASVEFQLHLFITTPSGVTQKTHKYKAVISPQARLAG
jgi:hypothetical protein